MPAAVRAGLVLLALLARPAAGQDFGVVSGLFEAINSIAFHGHGGVLASESDLTGALGGAGVELFIDLPSPAGMDLELGLGTSALGRFEASEPSLDLRASVRTLPRLSVYASRATTPGQLAVPYAGIGFGLAEMWNATGYTADGTAVPLSAQTYEANVAAGVALVGGPLSGLYAEVSAHRRVFEGLAWGTDVLPPRWPRQMDASSVGLSVGWQFRLTRSEAAE